MFASCRSSKRFHAAWALGMSPFPFDKADELAPTSTAIMLYCRFCALAFRHQRHENQPPNPKIVTVGLVPQRGNLSTGRLHHDGSPQPPARGGKNAQSIFEQTPSPGWGTKVDTYSYPRVLPPVSKVMVRRNTTHAVGASGVKMVRCHNACTPAVSQIPNTEKKIRLGDMRDSRSVN